MTLVHLQAVFFKMRVAGVLHIFQFDTKQGEDICMALQTHINDIMMKRYSKVRLRTSIQQVALDQSMKRHAHSPSPLGSHVIGVHL